MNFTPCANRALNKQDPYSKPTQSIPDQIVISKRHDLLCLADGVFDKEEQAIFKRSSLPHVSR